MTDIIPVLERFPVGSTVIWTRKMWSDRSQEIPCRVVGKTQSQGNGRLVLQVLSIKKTQIGRVLFIETKPAVKTTNIISLSDWWALRKGGAK
jgi:hypothetical protein